MLEKAEGQTLQWSTPNTRPIPVRTLRPSGAALRKTVSLPFSNLTLIVHSIT
jgi:hypothetical protein